MHIEDRLLTLEAQEKQLSEFNNYGREEIEKLRAYVDAINHQLTKLGDRVQSTEAQIRKLFALSNESRIIKTNIQANRITSDEIIGHDNKALKSKEVGHMSAIKVTCCYCGHIHDYKMIEIDRRVRLEEGNIAEIVYQLRCQLCTQEMIIKL